MSRLMDPVEQVIVLECLREGRRELGFRTSDVLAKKLAQSDSEDEIAAAQDCVLRRSISERSRSKFSEAALTIISDGENYKKLQSYFEKQGSHASRYLADIMFNCRGIDVANRLSIVSRFQRRTRYIDVIAQNWEVTSWTGRKRLQTGLYQMYRRYKPPGDNNNPDPNATIPDVMSHAIISELIYVDLDNMECVGVTSERNIYHGALSINHENILFGILQRSTDHGGLNRRFISMRLVHRRLPMYSGLCIKVGDTTRRPLAAGCLYVPIPPADHVELYSAFRPIVEQAWTGEPTPSVARESVVSQYLTDHPPLTPYDRDDPAWARVKFLRDFPQIQDLVVPDKDGTILFPEPSRTLAFDTLRRLSSRKALLPVFRWTSDPS